MEEEEEEEEGGEEVNGVNREKRDANELTKGQMNKYLKTQ